MMSLQKMLDAFPSPIDALAKPLAQGPIFPYPQVHSNWRDEQRAWTQTATLFNQSWHMHDLYIAGPDAKRLLSDTSVNSYATFKGGQAKQYLAVAPDGYVIGDSILFALSDDLYVVVGAPAAANWLRFHAETGDYDVSVSLELGRLFAGEGSVPKGLYRYELEGPNAQKILEKAVGGKIEPLKFFGWASSRSPGTACRRSATPWPLLPARRTRASSCSGRKSTTTPSWRRSSRPAKSTASCAAAQSPMAPRLPKAGGFRCRFPPFTHPRSCGPTGNGFQR